MMQNKTMFYVHENKFHPLSLGSHSERTCYRAGHNKN